MTDRNEGPGTNGLVNKEEAPGEPGASVCREANSCAELHHRRRRAVLTLIAARATRPTTSSIPARSVPPDVEAGSLKAVLGVLADGIGVAA